MKCIKGRNVKVCKSNAGYYVGTMEDGEPYCRLSGYLPYSTHIGVYGTDRMFCPENQFCNNGCNCFSGELKEYNEDEEVEKFKRFFC